APATPPPARPHGRGPPRSPAGGPRGPLRRRPGNARRGSREPGPLRARAAAAVLSVAPPARPAAVDRPVAAARPGPATECDPGSRADGTAGTLRPGAGGPAVRSPLQPKRRPAPAGAAGPGAGRAGGAARARPRGSGAPDPGSAADPGNRGDTRDQRGGGS